MKVKRFVIVKGYKIVELEEKINILKKEIIRKNSRIDFLETKNSELIIELQQNERNRGHTMTNFERIKEMSVEELAYFLHTVNLSLSDVMKSSKDFYIDNDIIDWLESENNS